MWFTIPEECSLSIARLRNPITHIPEGKHPLCKKTALAATYDASGAGGSLYTVRYGYDLIGRITGKTETVNGVATTYGYTYDLAGRLVQVDTNGIMSSSYSYDNNGNRISATINGVTTQGFYDLQDRLTTYGATTFAYNDNGELTTKTDAAGTTAYNYDVFGNLRSATLANGTAVAYTIGGNASLAPVKKLLDPLQNSASPIGVAALVSGIVHLLVGGFIPLL